MLDALKTVADNAIPGFQLLQKDDEVLDRNAILKLEGGQVHPRRRPGASRTCYRYKAYCCYTTGHYGFQSFIQ